MAKQRAEINRGLPTGLRCRDGYYVFLNRMTGVEHGLGRDQRKAIIAAKKVNAAYSRSRPTLLEKIGVDARPAIDEQKQARLAKLAYYGMAARARKASMPVMSRDDLDRLVARANGRCELTDIPFSDESNDLCHRRPWMPSVDRIDSRKGYEFENCRLVCLAVNLALNEFGDAVLLEVAKGLLYKQRRFGEETGNSGESV